MKKRKLLSILMTVVMVMSLLPAKVLYADVLSGISLVTVPSFTFGAATEGYGTQAPYSVQIVSTGTESTGALTIGLSGDNPDAFELSKTSISDIAADETDYFTVKPVTGLEPDTYTATVTVSGGNVGSQSFDVSFTVSPAGATYEATIYTYIDNIATDVTGTVELKKGISDPITVSKTGTGIYTATVENGDYFIYIDGKDTGRSIAISAAAKSVNLNYYTVIFAATTSGTAVGSSISATANGSPISSGAVVLAQKNVVITAAGTGAGSYTYAWDDAGNTTTATLNIPSLNSPINVTCTIDGTGLPPEDPDYTVNGEGQEWTGSDETVLLTGASDELVILKAPTAVVKIDVQSEDGSEVTIDGNSIDCVNTYVVVSNDITLNLNDLNITAPDSAAVSDSKAQTGLFLNKTDSEDDIMTLNVTGTCNINGAETGSGIASTCTEIQRLHITGSGTLNANGGNTTVSVGGTGIYLVTFGYNGTEIGAKLTIDEGVTVNARGGSSAANTGGVGIKAAWGDVEICDATVTAIGGASSGVSSSGGIAIQASFLSGFPTKGGSITVKDGTLTATGGQSLNYYGGDALNAFNALNITGGTVIATGGDSTNGIGGTALYAYNGDLNVEGGTVTANGGNSTSNTGGTAVLAYYGDLNIEGGTVTANGGDSINNAAGTALYAYLGDLSIEGGTLTANGGDSTNNSGNIALYAYNGDLNIKGGTVTVTGGNGKINGSHAIFVNVGTIAIENGVNLTAIGGDGETGLGGVGIRAYGNTVTIANNAGDIYVRGGQGATAQRASVMGKEVYIGTGNIGTVLMEGTNPRTIKNTVDGDGLYMVNVSTSPAAEVEIQCQVDGELAGPYTYRAIAAEDGTASLWLPQGAQILSGTGYSSANIDVADNDTNNSATLITLPSIVTAYNSTELKTYMASPQVSTINLVSGTEYTYNGTVIQRSLTINGNGAVINVGTGFDDTIMRRASDNYVTGKVFLAVQGTGSSLTMNNVTLSNTATRLLAVINVKTGGSLLLDGVTFDGFFANKADDPAPTAPNSPGSYNNFGVHAEPGAISTTIKNSTFSSSNSFRNAVAIRNGTALITNNTFVGTDNPARQNQGDGYEYAIFLYGGTTTVTGNDISGYDSILKTDLGYHSAAISACPYYDLTATVTGNKLHNNARGIDFAGSYHAYSHPATASINGIVLTTSENAFKIGESLNASNTFLGNEDGNISVGLDQNDHYIDSITGIEFGPPAYFAPFIKAESTGRYSATFSFDKGTWAQAMLRNKKAFSVEASTDNGVTWTAVSITGSPDTSLNSVTVSLDSGKTYLLRAVLTITANTMPYDTVGDEYTPADIISYSNTVSVTTKSGGGSGSPSKPASNDSSGAPVLVNGEAKSAGTAKTTTGSDGRITTTVTVDSGKLEAILAAEPKGATVTIPVTGKSNAAVGVLTGDMIKSMESQDAKLVLKTDSANYTLPASEINIDAVSKQLGTNVSLKDISVTISIAEPTGQMTKVVENAAKEGGFTIMVPSVDYTVTCSYGGKTTSVSSFNAYVERMIAIPEGVDPSKITTGVVVDPDGSVYHVPTRVTVIDGKYYAVINSLTNSTYSVVWNPIEFSDVTKHWAKASINNMGSRMVVSGIGSHNYDPDRNMTRAEFAAVIVRALGLEPETGVAGFGDVKTSEWYNGYIKTAVSYGIIKGYTNGNFGPNDTITREQSMTMIGMAMKVTGLKVNLTEAEMGKLIDVYTDRKAISQYANDSIAACLTTGIVTGRGNNKLAPKAYVSRAEVAVMVEKLLKKSNLI